MICPNCKKQISKGSKFCPYCGYRISNYNLHNVEKKLGPKHTESPLVNSNDSNPKHISKKAKILFGCIIAAAIIGGGVHHYHYRQTPASVNLSQQMSDKSYHMGNFMNTIMNTASDRRLPKGARYLMGKFNNGRVQLSYKGHNASDNNSDSLNYSIQGKDLTLSMDNNSDPSDKEYLNLDLKLIHTNESHKDLTFKVANDSDKVSDNNNNNQQMLDDLMNRKINFKQS